MKVSRYLVLALLFLTLAGQALALTPQELEVQGKLLAEFLVTGRGVVAQSLPKYDINNAAIGDKGFTPQLFSQEINAQFKASTGIDIVAGKAATPLPGNTLELLATLLEASRQVCADNQMLINMQGVGFKGFIPATYGKMVGDIFREKTGITLKQTSLRYRNAYNVPDSFEKSMLTKMESLGYPKGEVVVQPEGGNFRMMRPVYIQKACLSCHGDPKGELDVAGRKKEGYRDGELRGAISVLIPAK